ncbi:MAG TPA: hypothetical protein VFT83_04325, partial [Nitrososphaeraceae archaeon]|nr:hypothetical protein [Nitrososphaeraceae archaeon]
MILFTLRLIATISLTLALQYIIPFLSFYQADAQIIDQNLSNIQQNQPLQQQQPSSIHGNLKMGSFVNDRISGTANNDIIIALSGSDVVHGLVGND